MCVQLSGTVTFLYLLLLSLDWLLLAISSLAQCKSSGALHAFLLLSTRDGEWPADGDTVLAGGSVEKGGESADIMTLSPDLRHDDTPTDWRKFAGLRRHWGTEMTGKSTAICFRPVDTLLWYMYFWVHATEVYNHFKQLT